MSKINVLIVGASGRMGQSLIQEISLDKELVLVAAIDHKSSDKLGRDAGEAMGIITGVKIDHDIEKVISSADVLIDFTRPEASMGYLKLCEAHHVKYVIGTTGFSDQEKKIILDTSKKIPIVFAPNMSVGVKLGVISSDKVNLSVLAKWGLLSDPLSLDRGGYLSLSAPIQVNLNEIMYTRAEITLNGIGGDLQRIGLLALGYKVGPKVNFICEYQLNQHKSIQDKSWNNRSSVGVAFQYETMNHLLLDLGVSNTFDSLLGLNIGEFYVVKAGLTHNWEQWRKRRNKNTPSEIY